MFVPRSHGGLELDVPTAVKVIEAFAAIDGSIGWTAMANGGAALFAPLLPRETFERIYQNGPDVIIAGSTVVGGAAAAREPESWSVTGRWPFASGSQHADWLLAVCVVTNHGKPVFKADGSTPVKRAFFLSAHDWIVEDTGYATGSKGTCSSHLALNAAWVPEQNFFDLATDEPCVPGPLYRGFPYFVPLLQSAVCLGIARSAFDDVVALAQSKWRQESAEIRLRKSELLLGKVSQAFSDLRTAQAFYDTLVARHWRHVVSGAPKDNKLLALGVQTSVWIAARCVAVVEGCFELGSESPEFEGSALQRRMHDIRVATQYGVALRRNHPNVDAIFLRKSGRGKTCL
jgi:alkylation response protein AidB-like acyl-CoA dehydrogenase